MKVKKRMKNRSWYIHWMMLALAVLCLVGCKDKSQDGGDFDPDKALVVSSFSPEEGGVSTRLLIAGENFGTDISKIRVTIGGKNAKVVGSNGTTIYCVVPNQAYEGTIEVSIVDEKGDEIVKTTPVTKFTYVKKRIVTTLLGQVDDKGNYEVKDGPFHDCGGVAKCDWLSFDPQNPNHLYFTADGNAFRKLDLENQYLSSQFGDGHAGMNRMRSIAWTLDGDMIIATDKGGDQDASNWILKRDSDFKTPNTLTKSRQCNGSDIHPINGELYFNRYGDGQLFRYDFETKEQEFLFSIQDREWEFTIQIHPSGDYAYIVVINQEYILRTDYDHNSKKFTTPYIVCGEQGQRGWVDGVGKRSRLSRPYQGAFVKNPKYIEEGKTDEYDFYFCDSGNQCIRTLTPEGRVSTFAGRGSLGVNMDAHGYIDGDLRLEARFHNPEGLAYDEVNDIFYIGDRDNRRIRKIAYEQ